MVQRRQGVRIHLSGGDRARLFLHYSAIESDGFKTLAEGDRVEFDLVDGPKGPAAANVVRVPGS